MNTIKVAISMPVELVEIIDRLRKKHGISRSRFISTVMTDKIQEERNRELKKSYDAVFSDKAVKKEQLETANFFEGVGNREGLEW